MPGVDTVNVAGIVEESETRSEDAARSSETRRWRPVLHDDAVSDDVDALGCGVGNRGAAEAFPGSSG